MNKEPFELSLWDTKGEEKLKYILASDTMDSLAGAQNVEFLEKINGETSLTFKIYYKYRDENNELIDNPFFDSIVNEARIKLRVGKEYKTEGTFPLKVAYANSIDYDNRWHDFVVKQVVKNTQDYSATVQCKELFYNELGKNGWAVTLNTEIENNYGTVSELATAILDGSNWKVDENSYKPIERIAEPMLVCKLTQDITAHGAKMALESNSYLITSGSYIYIFYSLVKLNDNNVWELNNDKIQFLYNGSYFTRDNLDDEYKIIDDKLEFNYEIRKEDLINSYENLIMTGSGSQYDPGHVHLTGDRIEKIQKTHFSDIYDGFVYDWTAKETQEYKDGDETKTLNVGDPVISYIETDYSKINSVSNKITNSTNFTSAAGWEGYKNIGSDPIEVDAQMRVFPELDKISIDDPVSKLINYLYFPFNTHDTYYKNVGPTSNRLELIKDNIYVFRLHCRWIDLQKVTNINQIPSHVLKNKNEFPKLTFSLKYKSESLEEQTVISQELNFASIDESVQIIQNGINAGYFAPNGTNADRKHPFGIGENHGELNTLYIDENGYCYIFVKANESTTISEQTLMKNSDRLYMIMTSSKIDDNYVLHIDNIQFFEYINGSISDSLFPEYTTIETVIFPEDNVTSLISDTEYFCVISENGKELLPLSSDKSLYSPSYEDDYQSVRHIEIKQSNYFNNIQQIAELFQVWVNFNIQHKKNGKIYLDENGNPIKRVKFSKYSPNGNVINYSGFKRGINENSISREVNSDELATKVIVINNSQEYATDGMCSIARATANPTGETEIYNFNYYIEQGLIDNNELSKDLYSSEEGYLNYYPTLKQLNNLYDADAIDYNKYYITRMTFDSQRQTYEAAISSIEKEMAKINIWLEELDPENNTYQSYLSAYRQNKASLDSYNASLETALATISFYDSEMARLDEEMLDITAQKKELKQKFYNKYYQYIQEGTWTDDQYMDDNLYYSDGLKVSETSAYPKVQYTINVIDIKQIQEYKEYNFKVGQRTYLEDPEFFGYKIINFNGKDHKTPNRIEVIVSEYRRVFDNPSTSVVIIQNYKNQFEELFQKITATSQSLEYATGSYERAADSFASDGGLSTRAFENGFATNEMTLMSNSNTSISWDTQSGISITDQGDNNKKVKIDGNGIYCSNDGGYSWSAGVTGDGINANTITAGNIDVNKITITNNNTPYFKWDKDGIKAYKINEESAPNEQAYVNYNQYGLYGTTDEALLQEKIDEAIGFDEKINAVQEWANFALTYKGLNINDEIGTQDPVKIHMGPGEFEIYKPEYISGKETGNKTVLFGIDKQGGVSLNGSNTTGNGLIVTNGEIGSFKIVDPDNSKQHYGLAYGYEKSNESEEFSASFGIFPPDVGFDKEIQTGEEDSMVIGNICTWVQRGLAITESGRVFSYNPFIIDGIISQDLLPENSSNDDTPSYTANIGSSAKPFLNVWARNKPTPSSGKIKNNIADLTEDYYDIDSMRPVFFQYNEDDKPNIGFIAEEMAESCPTATAFKNHEAVGIDYGKLVTIAIKEIQSLRKRVTELENKLNEKEKDAN